jgi:hypothetical protein
MKFCPVDPEICRGQVHVPKKERRKRRKRIRIRKTRYDYNLTILIMKSQGHILRGSKGVGVTIESYGKVEISYINVDNF